MSRSVAFVVAVCLVISCGDGNETSTATDQPVPAATVAPSEPTQVTLPAEPVPVGDVAFTDPAITSVTEAVCRGYGRIAADGGAALTGVLAPDATIVDAVSGTTYTGAAEIAAYADGLRDEGLQDAVCIHLTQADRWVAHTITLLLDGTAVRAGLLAVHVNADGSVDEVAVHLSDRADPPRQRVDPDTGVRSVGNQLCEHYVAGDVDGVLGLMTEDPVVHTRREITGTDGVTDFMTTLPYDIHTCGVAIQNERWEAIESIMTDPAAGTERSMLSVLALDDDSSVADHWFYFDS